MVRAICLAVILFPSAVLATELRCEISSKYTCSREGCSPNKLGVWNLIDLERGKFSRCDRNGCDQYDANVSQSGIYYNIEVPGHGVLAKMTLDGTEYIEVATLGTTVLVSFGSCGEKPAQ